MLSTDGDLLFDLFVMLIPFLSFSRRGLNQYYVSAAVFFSGTTSTFRTCWLQLLSPFGWKIFTQKGNFWQFWGLTPPFLTEWTNKLVIVDCNTKRKNNRGPTVVCPWHYIKGWTQRSFCPWLLCIQQGYTTGYSGLINSAVITITRTYSYLYRFNIFHIVVNSNCIQQSLLM